MLKKIIVLTVLGLILQPICVFIYKLGLNTHYHQHHPGQCQTVKGMSLGSEDFNVFPDGLAFITSGLQCPFFSPTFIDYMKKHNVVGNIYLFNYKNPNIHAQKLTIEESNVFNYNNFRPHGISGWDDPKTGNRYLFVVNHDTAGVESIEKFQYIPKTNSLKHVQKYTDNSTMIMLNSVQATGVNSFYFTNNAPYFSRIITYLQFFGQLSLTTVSYFDGVNYRDVLTSMPIANGIAMSNDKSHIYVASNLKETIMVYKREKSDDLTLKQIYPLYTVPDNILVDFKTGDLYVGCHRITYKTFLHLDDPSVKAPSQVLKLKVKDNNITEDIELFYDHGDMIKASTSAYVYDNKLLIGSVMDTLVYCGVNVPH